MTRPITADLRRESIELLEGVGGTFTEKTLTSSNSFDETVPLRRIIQMDQEPNKNGDFNVQNGHRTKDDKHGGYSSGKTWGFRSEEYRRRQNQCYRFLEMPRGCVSVLYHALL